MAGNVIVRSVLGARGPVAGLAVTLAGVAASVEMFAWSERNSGKATYPLWPGPPFTVRATRCSACSRRASRPRTSWMWGVPRLPRRCLPPPGSTCREGATRRAFRALHAALPGFAGPPGNLFPSPERMEHGCCR